MLEIDKMFEAAIALRDEGHLKEAVLGFLAIITKFPHDSKIGLVHTILGGVYLDLKDYHNSSLSFKNGTRLNPKSELASLGLYLSYVKLDRDKEAINELKRYLDEYPANMYKDTLEELLEDMKKGFATAYKKTIFHFAKKNGVITK